MTRNRDQCDADPWGAAVDVPEWNPPSEPRPPADPEPADLDGPRDELPIARARFVGRRRRRSVDLIRPHRFALIAAACFVVAALEMLSIRPDHRTRADRPADPGRHSQVRALGAKQR